MHKLDLIRFAGACGLAILGCSVAVAPTQGAPLSDKQQDEIAEFFKCQGYLMRGNLVAFEADADCGHGPVPVDSKSLGSTKGDGTPVVKEDCEPLPTFSLVLNGNDYCLPAD
jgi:hypothetical protein